MTYSIEKSFLIDPLTTNNAIYRESLTLIFLELKIWYLNCNFGHTLESKGSVRYYNNNAILEGIIDIYSRQFFIYGLPVQFMPKTQPAIIIILPAKVSLMSPKTTSNVLQWLQNYLQYCKRAYLNPLFPKKQSKTSALKKKSKKGCLPQVAFGPFLNTLSHMSLILLIRRALKKCMFFW